MSALPSEDEDEELPPPVDQWIKDQPFITTAEVDIPPKLVEQVIGQEKAVMAYRFITKDSIEEKVSALQADKRILEKSLISEVASDEVPLSEAMLEGLLMDL